MRGVTEEEFKNGENDCKEDKCVRKGESLEEAMFCRYCNKMLPFDKNHNHEK